MADLALETILLGLVGFSLLAAAGLGFYIWQSGRNKPAESVVTTQRTAEELQENGLQLVSQASEILKIIQAQIAAGDRFSSSLAEADKKLPLLTDPEKVRMVVKFLVAENAKMQSEASELKKNLEQSQVQIESLRTNLAHVEEVSVKDSLTGVANRRGYEQAIAKAISEATKLSSPLSIIMCDLDHFKKINDTYGHIVGDEVLKVFAGVLSENVRFGDTVARFGGEEFVVVLTMTDAKGGMAVAERMRSQMANRRLSVTESGQSLGNVTASFGVAQFVPGDTEATLLARADAKLYEAKAAGRNTICADTPAAPLAA